MTDTKTLHTLQTLCKVGKILSKIVFIFCLVGGIGCLVGITGLALVPGELRIGGVTIHGWIEQSSEISLGTCYAAMAAAAVLCAGEAVISKMAELFFRHELAAGTPFTFPGAKELIRLGICTVCISLGASGLAALVWQIMALFFENVREMSFGGISSVGLGIMFIFTGLLCRYGAEVTAEKNQKKEKS